MLRLFLACAAFSIATAPAGAQVAAPPGEAPKPAPVRVSLQTSEGPLVVEVESERAPITSANFLRYVDQRRLDGAAIYRSSKVAPGFGLIQGGVRNDPKRLLRSIPHEPTSKTGLTHSDGTISMARGAPGTANGDFFITVGAMPSLDADSSRPGDNLGFATFGRIVEGMDVVRRILDAPTSPTAGEGAMRGQMLAAPVRIVAARRVK